MVLNNITRQVIQLILFILNITLCSVHIDDVIVPEAVSVDSGAAVIECIYSGLVEDFTVRWMFNGTQFFEWSSGMEPRVYGILDGRISVSTNTNKKQALNLMVLSSDLSGNYTCIVYSDGQEARLTKSMIVYSPERDFQLICNKGKLKCIAKGIYPQPDLTIELNKVPIAQQQRIWRNGSLFDAECIAKMTTVILKYGEISCRLQIPQVDYTAIIKKNIGRAKNAAVRIVLTTFLLGLHYIAVIVRI